MTINDRGAIKWTSLMLPEHKMMLSDLYEKEHHSDMPELDEQKAEEVNAVIHHALTEERQVSVTFYRESTRRTIIGHIKKIDAANHNLEVSDCEGQSHKIAIQTVIDADTV